MPQTLTKKKLHHLSGRGYGDSPIVIIGERVFRKVSQPDGSFRLVRENHKFNGQSTKPWSRSRRSKKFRRMMKAQNGCNDGYFRHKEKSIFQGQSLCKQGQVYLPEDEA